MLGLGAVAATPSSAATVKDFSHTCRVVVDDGNTQGVFCIDLEGTLLQPGDYLVESKVTALCQFDADLPESVTTQCSNVSLGFSNGETVWYFTQTPGGGQFGGPDGCGHGQSPHPNCSTGRNFFGDIEDGLGPYGEVQGPGCDAFYSELLEGATINLPVSNKQGTVPSTGLSTPTVNINDAGNTC
jgi:hypothetical protein